MYISDNNGTGLHATAGVRIRPANRFKRSSHFLLPVHLTRTKKTYFIRNLTIIQRPRSDNF